MNRLWWEFDFLVRIKRGSKNFSSQMPDFSLNYRRVDRFEKLRKCKNREKVNFLGWVGSQIICLRHEFCPYQWDPNMKKDSLSSIFSTSTFFKESQKANMSLSMRQVERTLNPASKRVVGSLSNERKREERPREKEKIRRKEWVRHRLSSFKKLLQG